jgi:tRNA(Ile)-lysidine synthase
MDLLEQYKAFIKKENLFQPKDKLLLAVSGGVDSVVLCELCNQAGYDFAIAHCNFRLRGTDSDRDEAFVKELAKKYGVGIFVKGFDTEAISKQEKKSIEETARDLRYTWFHELIGNRQQSTGNRQQATGNRQEAMDNRQRAIGNMQEASSNNAADSDCQLPIANCSLPIANCSPPIANWILTAHHADDNIETVLMNFFRGTGIKGLRGILPKQGQLIRPLLFARRSELEAFVTKNELRFVTDHTNAENEYTRNYFRNMVIPLVDKSFPDVTGNLLKNIQRFGETEILYRQAIAWHKKKLLEHRDKEVHIPVLKLKKTTPLATVVYEIIKEYGFTAHQTDEVIGLLQSETGKYIQSPAYRIIKNRNWLIISPRQPGEAQNILIEETDVNVQLATGNLQLNTIPIAHCKLSVANSVALLDSSKITFPLLLRPWKKGDYFYPLGMKKKKKLSRFFTDQKLSLTQKEKVWVIESDKKIIWVVGLRIDERFKIMDSTSVILRLTFAVS